MVSDVYVFLIIGTHVMGVYYWPLLKFSCLSIIIKFISSTVDRIHSETGAACLSSEVVSFYRE